MGDQLQTRRTVMGGALLAATVIATNLGGETASAQPTVGEKRSPVLDLVKRLQAFEEIQNSVGRIAVAVNWHKPDAILNEFALDRPEVSIEYADEGVFKGPQAVKNAINAAMQPLRVGEMREIHVASPFIEVAKDLKSARTVFGAPGYGAEPQSNGLPVATWNWGTLAADYVPSPDGSWKMLHGHYFRFIECSYQEAFVDDLSRISRIHSPHASASATTYHHPYSPLTIRESIPALPRPYDTYNGIAWMLGKA